VAGAVEGWGGRGGTVAARAAQVGQVDWGAESEGVSRGWAVVAMVH